MLRFPGCELAVSEPRFPCFKFNAAMGFKHAAKLMVAKRLVRQLPRGARARDDRRRRRRFTLVPGPREVGIVELFRARMSRAPVA